MLVLAFELYCSIETSPAPFEYSPPLRFFSKNAVFKEKVPPATLILPPSPPAEILISFPEFKLSVPEAFSVILSPLITASPPIHSISTSP